MSGALVVLPHGLSWLEDPPAREAVAEQLALDEALLGQLADPNSRTVFRTYINPPSVILGLSRRIAQDVDVAVCEARGVPILRRRSGGGTVYHDQGTLNVAWAIPWDRMPSGCGPKSMNDATTDLFLGIVAVALDGLGIRAFKTRISDLSVGNPPRKIAGSGQARTQHGVLHHMSILVDLDLEAMAACLPIPPDRPGVAHADFVTSLVEAGLTGGLSDVESAIVDATRRAFGPPVHPFLEQFSLHTVDADWSEELRVTTAEIVEKRYKDEAWNRRF